MPGNFCAALGCSNNSSTVKQMSGYISFHRFPLNNNDLLQLWMAELNRAEFFPTLYSRVCSIHFEDDCFNYQKFTNRRELKKDAVPTKFIYPEENLSPYTRKRKQNEDNLISYQQTEHTSQQNLAQTREIIENKSQVYETFQEIDRPIQEDASRQKPEELDMVILDGIDGSNYLHKVGNSKLNNSEKNPNSKKYLENLQKKSTIEESYSITSTVYETACKCRKKCYLMFDELQQNKLLEKLNAIRNTKAQNLYLASHIHIRPVKRRVGKNKLKSCRNNTMLYYVPMNDIQLVEVCKIAFQNLHGINLKRLDRIIKKKKSLLSGWDEKTFENNQIDKDSVDKILEHVNERFLSQKLDDYRGMNLKDIYEDYLRWCDSKNVPIVNDQTYWFIVEKNTNFMSVWFHQAKTNAHTFSNVESDLFIISCEASSAYELEHYNSEDSSDGYTLNRITQEQNYSTNNHLNSSLSGETVFMENIAIKTELDHEEESYFRSRIKTEPAD